MQNINDLQSMAMTHEKLFDRLNEAVETMISAGVDFTEPGWIVLLHSSKIEVFTHFEFTSNSGKQFPILFSPFSPEDELLIYQIL